MGPPTAAGEMQPAIAGTSPSFDYAGFANRVALGGYPMMALKIQEEARKATPARKLKDTKTLMRGGQPVTVADPCPTRVHRLGSAIRW